MGETSVNIPSFWGKAQPLDVNRGPQWHPLAFHCLDVAAVGEVLLTRHRGLGDSLSRLLCLSREEAVSLVCFLLCLHDIGKFAKKFQAKVPHLYPDCFGDDPTRLAGFYNHGAGGLRLFDASGDLFNLPSGGSPGVWRPLISAVAGHHGVPPEPRIGEGPAVLQGDYGRAGVATACAFIRRAHEVFALPPALPSLDRWHVRRGSFAVAGVAVLADWIGSNRDWFPYREPLQDMKAYWADAQKQAGRAVEQAGVLPASITDHLDYGKLIGATATPSPMQDWARSAELPAGPALFMIEDETGSGKTEAALMLAHRLMKSGGADGLYIALPTMATSNAMFDRLGAAHRSLFVAETKPSIALVHGARDLHPGFRPAVLRGGRNEDSYSTAGRLGDESETTASTACAAWIADDRRRAFLADAGAGTVDQALLSVLPSRHQSLRLLGLMRRVLILDEVHAYDAYMQREIETLLEFQAGLGGSAILLSATLSEFFRKRLADAFAKGLGAPSEPVRTSYDRTIFPMATIRASGGQTSTKVAGRSGRARALPVRFLRTLKDALNAVEQAARAGKAVLYIRNTVDDALEAHAALTTCGLNPVLFHARFALVDRLAIESCVVKTFGKKSTPEGRAGKVLIATQVVEQSLDLDFDALVTDLAPIDLLIQRAGRLWRHNRRERKGQPELLVMGPTPDDEAKADWFSKVFPRAAYVYRDHARLWLTAKTLVESGVIESPGGLRSLIETVYGDDAEAGLPDGLKECFFNAEGRTGAERGVATTNTLNLGKGYVRDGGSWDSDLRTPTRFVDDPQVTLRLARIGDGCIEPYARIDKRDEPWRAWRLSEINVTSRRVGGETVPPEHTEAARAAKANWARFDTDKVLVLLVGSDAADGTLTGSVASSTAAGKEVRLSYNAQVGLRWLRTIPN